MPTPGLNLIAILIFSLTFLSLLGPLLHISPTVPALTTVSLLGLVTIDTWVWSGQGMVLFGDWLAQKSPAYRDRIIHHEAGHFLVAMVLGIPVTGYTLCAWDAWQQGQPGRGGVRFGDPQLQGQLAEGKLTTDTIDRYCQVWLAGGVAEELVYQSVQGAEDDRQQVRLLLASIHYAPQNRLAKERWAAQNAKALLQTHWETYQTLVKLLQDKAPLALCQDLFKNEML